jgi:hypothetical protein
MEDKYIVWRLGRSLVLAAAFAAALYFIVFPGINLLTAGWLIGPGGEHVYYCNSTNGTQRLVTLDDDREEISGGTHECIVVQNNVSAADASYQQVIDFILADKTDEIEANGSWVCAEYAVAVHDAIEAAGVRCGVVAIHFGVLVGGHGILVFNTTDQGPVYIDETEDDWVAHCAPDETYTRKSLHTNETNSIDRVIRMDVYW